MKLVKREFMCLILGRTFGSIQEMNEARKKFAESLRKKSKLSVLEKERLERLVRLGF